MSAEREMLAWASGFFEGEGCVGAATGVERSLVLTVVNTDLERLSLFAEIVGGGSIRERLHVARQGLKRQYQWRAYGDTAIRVFRGLEPWLGERRRARFAELLALREAYIAEATCQRPCVWCAATFSPAWGAMARRTLYCSPACSQRARNARRALKRRDVRGSDVQELLDANVVAA